MIKVKKKNRKYFKWKKEKTDFVRHDPHDTQFWPLSKTLCGIVYIVFELRPGCLQVVDHNQKQQGV